MAFRTTIYRSVCIKSYYLFCRKGEHMGMESPLPYLNPRLKGNKLLHGANFASAGIGILNDTGIQFVCPRMILIIYLDQYTLLI